MYLPARNIRCLPDMHRTARVDDGARDIVIPRAEDEFLVDFRRASLHARDEPGAHPHPGGPIGERGGEPAPVGDTARCDDDDRLACERAFGVLAEVDDGRNEDREGCLARVAAALSALSANDVNTWLEGQFR